MEQRTKEILSKQLELLAEVSCAEMLTEDLCKISSCMAQIAINLNVSQDNERNNQNISFCGTSEELKSALAVLQSTQPHDLVES